MANEISLDITETVTKVEVTEDVTSINITPSVTTVELKGISIAQGFSSTATTYDGSSNTLGYGTSVSTALDHINTNGFNKNADNTINGDTTVAYGHTFDFTGAGEGQNVYVAMNLRNNNIIGVNNIRINDAGDHEGVEWPNWKIFESPNPFDGEGVDGNQEGNFQIAYENGLNNWETRLEVKPEGIDVTGNADVSGNFVVDTDTLYVDSTNNEVGIGTTNPTAKFEVVGTGGQASGFAFKNSHDTVRGYFGSDNDNADFLFTYVGTESAEVKLKHNGNVILCENGGNVGINKAGPQTALDVYGTITGTGLDINGDGDISNELVVGTKVEAPLFKGDLEGAVHFKATDSGTTLAKGDVVYITGYEGNKTTVDKADASDSAKMPAFGIVNSVTGSNVDVLTFGSMLHLSTTGIATGTELYVSATTPGGYETSAPTGEGNLVQKIAKVVRGDSNSGSIKIMGAGRTNATPNLNNGNIFIGNSSNIPTTASFDTTFASSFATRFIDEDNMDSNSATHVPSQQSVKAYVDAEVAGLVNGAPDDLNTLHELADALAEDANFSTTVTTSIGNKLAKASNLSDLTNAATARTNLGLGTAATIDFDGAYSSLSGLPTLFSGAYDDLSDAPITVTANDLTISKSLLPNATETLDIGSSSLRFNDIYLAGDTIDLGGTKLSKDDNGDFEIKDANNAFKKIKASEIELDDPTKDSDNKVVLRMAADGTPEITKLNRTSGAETETAAKFALLTVAKNVTASTAPTDNAHLTNKQYVDGLASNYATAAQGTLATDALPASNVSAFGGTLIDDTDAATARTTLGLGSASTSSSTDFASAAQGSKADAVHNTLTTVQIQSTNLSANDFKAAAGKRLIKTPTTSGTVTLTIFAPAAEDVGKTWTLMNPSAGKFSLAFNTQRVFVMNGSDTTARLTNFELNSGGVADLICIASNSGGGTSTNPNFVLYGTGIVDV